MKEINMRVLVACEYSGVVRDAFKSAGHNAWSCDFLPSESTGAHYEGDVRHMLEGWNQCNLHHNVIPMAVAGVI